MEEMRKNIGDEVVVKRYMEDGFLDDASGLHFVGEMKKYSGLKAKITRLHSMNRYRIDIDNGSLEWADTFFENDCIISKIQSMKNRLAELEAESLKIKSELISIKNTLNEI